MQDPFLRRSMDLDPLRRFGAALADTLRVGDMVLLNGPLGAGKTELARAVLHHLMEKEGTFEDVPSPSFTLVQVYEFSALDVWHTDLYRLDGIADVDELGLFDALETAALLIEWPDRLGPHVPKEALSLTLEVAEDGTRCVSASGAAEWRNRLGTFAEQSDA